MFLNKKSTCLCGDHKLVFCHLYCWILFLYSKSESTFETKEIVVSYLRSKVISWTYIFFLFRNNNIHLMIFAFLVACFYSNIKIGLWGFWNWDFIYRQRQSVWNSPTLSGVILKFHRVFCNVTMDVCCPLGTLLYLFV